MSRPVAGEFYRHYKYDPSGEFANFTYVIIGTGLHTEERYQTIIYKPLYTQTAFLGECDYCVRPYDMFMGTVLVDGHEQPRFKKITDEEVLATLRAMQ